MSKTSRAEWIFISIGVMGFFTYIYMITLGPWASRPSPPELMPVSPEIAAKIAEARVAQAKAQADRLRQEQVSFLKSPAGEVCKQNPSWSREMCGLVARRKIQIGMTKDQVRASWGRPERTHRYVRADVTREQWVYGSTWVHFTDGVLESWID